MQTKLSFSIARFMDQFRRPANQRQAIGTVRTIFTLFLGVLLVIAIAGSTSKPSNLKMRMASVDKVNATNLYENSNKNASAPFATWYRDFDKDGYGDPAHTAIAPVQPAGFIDNNEDCNDFNKNINPGMPEIPDNGIDENCYKGDATTWYRDADGDGFGDPKTGFVRETKPNGYVHNKLDCDDTDPEIGSKRTYFEDKDGDKYGDLATKTLLCPADATSGFVTNGSDCDDNDATAHQKWTFYKDNDGDGVGDVSNSTYICHAPTAPSGYAKQKGDCNDSDPSIIYRKTYFTDNDGDGYGNPSTKTLLCESSAPSGYATNGSDCNDNQVTYFDGDHDGYGSQLKFACGVADNSDCNDKDPKIQSCTTTGTVASHQEKKPIEQQATHFTLSASPNPVTKTTRILYSVPVDAQVSLKIYDALGREVNTLFSGARRAGNYSQAYNTNALSSGVYYCRMLATANGKEYLQTQKLVKAE